VRNDRTACRVETTKSQLSQFNLGVRRTPKRAKAPRPRTSDIGGSAPRALQAASVFSCIEQYVPVLSVLHDDDGPTSARRGARVHLLDRDVERHEEIVVHFSSFMKRERSMWRTARVQVLAQDGLKILRVREPHPQSPTSRSSRRRRHHRIRVRRRRRRRRQGTLPWNAETRMRLPSPCPCL